MTYDASQDPLYHETHFVDEILKTQDYVKQALFALKNADIHASWKEPGVEWRGRTLVTPKTRNQYDFWIQKVQTKMKDVDPLFSDFPDERCLQINKFFLYNFHAPLRMNVHRRFDADEDEWEMGWIMEPEELIAYTTVKFIHYLDQTVNAVAGKVQWKEIMKSNNNFGYSNVFGMLNQFAYSKVKQHIITNEIDISSAVLYNSVKFEPQPDE